MIKNATFSGKFYEALELAALAHGKQRRKGTDIPYITHPLAAAAILIKHGFDEEVVIAAVLHDTVEDTVVTLQDIRQRFGEKVAVLVEGCPEKDRSAPWEERKSSTLDFLSEAPHAVAAVACADKLHNIISITRDYELHGNVVWKRFNRGQEKIAWYYRGLVEALVKSLGEETLLFQEFRAAVERLFDPAGDLQQNLGVASEQGFRNARPVKLSELIYEMEGSSDSMRTLLNLKSGEIVMVTTDYLIAAEDEEDPFEDLDMDWEMEHMELALDVVENWDNYEELPDRNEINEYNIIERFCSTLQTDELRETMCQVINGSGAFRRFTSSIRQYGIEDDWYRFRREAFREIAVRWCEEHQISYIG